MLVGISGCIALVWLFSKLHCLSEATRVKVFLVGAIVTAVLLLTGALSTSPMWTLSASHSVSHSEDKTVKFIGCSQKMELRGAMVKTL